MPTYTDPAGAPTLALFISYNPTNKIFTAAPYHFDSSTINPVAIGSYKITITITDNTFAPATVTTATATFLITVTNTPPYFLTGTPPDII